MYLNEWDDESEQGGLGIFGIGRKLKRAVRGAGKPLRKIGVLVNPVQALGTRSVFKLRKPLMVALNPVMAANILKGKRKKTRLPLLNVVNAPPAFQPIQPLVPSDAGLIPLPAPAKSIPTADFEDDEMTPEERSAFIDDAEPLVEPMSGGYAPPGGEESFAPTVPDMIEPGDLQPSKPAPKKPNTAAWIGGALLLKLLLF